jgi:hypothetical protein
MTDTLTQAVHGSVAAPGAGAVLASVTGLAAGEYEVLAGAYLSGAVPAVGDADNVQVQGDGGAVAGTLPVAPADNAMLPAARFVVRVESGTVSLVSPGAATASVVYHVFLSVASIPAGEYR